MTRNALILLLGIAALSLAAHAPARAITRDQVMVRAKAFANHPWRCTTANLTASCAPSYKSIYVPGDYLGLPYDWGGYMTLFEFDQQIATGYGAGSNPSDGVLACTAGLDCSGYVSKCWDAGHYSTSTMNQISSAIAQADILPGDAFNKAGSHIVLYSHTLASGSPILYESVPSSGVRINVYGGWSWVSGYTPVRYQDITGTTTSTPAGTADNPIEIGSFPFTDSRDTKTAASDVLDGCGAAPAKDNSGPEFIYQATFTQPGTLTASIADDVATDIDIILYSSMNTGDCVARDDSTISVPVECGTYYLVADTFRSASGQELAGPYTLTATFAPSGKPCGTPPPAYNFKGKLGDPCAFPGNENLPVCNSNLGAETCIYTSSSASGTSFCSRPCATVADCDAFPGGCCSALKSGERYCFIASLCPKGDGGLADSGTRDRGAPSLWDDQPAALDGAPASDGGPLAGDGSDGGGGCSCELAAARSSGAWCLLPVALLLGCLFARRRLRLKRSSPAWRIVRSAASRRPS